VTLSVSELLRAFTARSELHSVFTIGLASNRWMLWATGGSLLLVLGVVYLPFLQPFFYTVPLTIGDWFFMLPFLFASPVAMELLKIYMRYRKTRMMLAWKEA
jgi:Ca2+-transporting ATPase